MRRGRILSGSRGTRIQCSTMNPTRVPDRRRRALAGTGPAYPYQPCPRPSWKRFCSPPFEPTVRDGYVYARGADDNKAQHLASVKAAEHWFAAGGPPLNIRFLIEGEEEVSGRSLPDYVRANAARLRTDYLLIADGGFAAPGLPELVTGLRGLLYTEIEVTGPRVDLHSGIFGGVAPNPF